VASVGAAAAFIGLLFVAVTLTPERIFGVNAHPKRRADATRSFVALGNVFFISLAALIPRSGEEIMLAVSVASIAQLIREARRNARRYTFAQIIRTFGMVSLVIYGAEFVIILRNLEGHGNIDALVGIVFSLYSYALATSWLLLSQTDAQDP
jgi:hypothetical protein